MISTGFSKPKSVGARHLWFGNSLFHGGRGGGAGGLRRRQRDAGSELEEIRPFRKFEAANIFSCFNRADGWGNKEITVHCKRRLGGIQRELTLSARLHKGRYTFDPVQDNPMKTLYYFAVLARYLGNLAR